jgi:hypothetical protein
VRCLTAFLLSASALVAQQAPYNLRTAAEARQAERNLQANPQADPRADMRNDALAGALLDFYLSRWTDEKLHAARIHLLQWVVTNRSDIDPAATVHDVRGLLVGADDKEAYATLRLIWLRQVNQQPSNTRVLLNAARFLQLTDREAAAGWLKTAANYDSDSLEYASALARLYAYAITGVVAMSPQEEPSRLDPEETKSLFARQAKDEAMQDSLLCARVGWNVHLIAMGLRAAGLTEADYDTVAEELLLNAANLDFPKPARLPYLAQFYRDQSLKVTHKILPKFSEVEVKAKDEAQQVVDFPKKIIVDELTKPVKVSVSVLIGMDGHVWKSEATSGEEDRITRVATTSLLGWTFKPVRVSGEPVQLVTTFEVTIEPPPPPAKRK